MLRLFPAGASCEWFQTFLERPGGFPPSDIFGDVFARLDPERVPELTFMAWTQAIAAVAARAEVVAIDGKTARRSHEAARVARELMHQYGHSLALQNTLTLGQVRKGRRSPVLGDRASSTAIPSPKCIRLWLDLLDLRRLHRDH